MTKVRVRRRLDRIELGNFGDTSSVEGSPEEFYVALRNVIKANQGTNQVAAETELGRESLYKTLSESGNPQFSTVSKIIGALGLQISIGPIMETS